MPAGRFVLRDLARTPPIPGGELLLPDEIGRQARDVLRLRPGEPITLLDGAGGEYPCVVARVSRREVAVKVGHWRAGLAAHTPPVTLCVGLLKAARLELALRMGTEVGVSIFQPLLTERSVALADELSAGKRRRYEHILAEALEQCGGAWLPELREPLPLEAALAAVPAGGVALIPWEEAGALPLAEALRVEMERLGGVVTGVWLFTGPEGGFSAGEVALAERRGARAVTLGPRILRAETAALVAATLALGALGALDAGPHRGGAD